jgi:hypothetical protein
VAGLGGAWHSVAGHGPHRLSRHGISRRGSGKAMLGLARLGEDPYCFHGNTGLGRARHGLARQGEGLAGHGDHQTFEARQGQAMRVEAMRVKAHHGVSQQG